MTTLEEKMAAIAKLREAWNEEREIMLAHVEALDAEMGATLDELKLIAHGQPVHATLMSRQYRLRLEEIYVRRRLDHAHGVTELSEDAVMRAISGDE